VPAVKQIQSGTIERKVEIVQEQAEHARSSALMRISPPLQSGDRFHYSMKERLPENFYTFADTLESLQNSREKGELFGLSDYFGWNINRPTRRFSLDIIFPDGWIPTDDSAKVLYASASSFPSTREQNEELQRLEYARIASKDNRYQLKMTSNYPMIGLIYIITWLPIYKNKTPVRPIDAQGKDLTYKDYQTIARILAGLPSFETAGSRQTLLFLAGVERFIDVDLNGSAQMVAGMIVYQLTKYGHIEDGEPGESALGRLLQYLTSYALIPRRDKKVLEDILSRLER
jgi:hypothetical protein